MYIKQNQALRRCILQRIKHLEDVYSTNSSTWKTHIIQNQTQKMYTLQTQALVRRILHKALGRCILHKNKWHLKTLKCLLSFLYIKKVHYLTTILLINLPCSKKFLFFLFFVLLLFRRALKSVKNFQINHTKRVGKKN